MSDLPREAYDEFEGFTKRVAAIRTPYGHDITPTTDAVCREILHSLIADASGIVKKWPIVTGTTSARPEPGIYRSRLLDCGCQISETQGGTSFYCTAHQPPALQVTCARCGIHGTSDTFMVEEGDEWECPSCWERCEAKERTTDQQK